MNDFTAQEILAIASNLDGKLDCDAHELARRHIAAGSDVQTFRAAALSKIKAYSPVTNTGSWGLSDVPARDWRNYSITNAIRCQLPGNKPSGFEAEMSDEIAHRVGKRAEGFYIPDEAFTRNLVAGGVTVTSNTLGGYVALAQSAPGEFIEVLRNKSQVLNLGARTMNLTQSVVIPRQYATGTVNWVGETVASTLTGIGIQGLTLSPKAISAYHQYSKQLLMQSNPSIDMLVRDDIVQTLAQAIDLAALHGTGSSDPTGIVNTAGINAVTLSANGLALGNATAYPALVSLETALATSNADGGSLAYLMRPGHRGALRTTQRFASTDTPVWDPATNTVNGYRAEVTNQLSTNLTVGTATTITSPIVFANWSDIVVANFGATDLCVDPFSAGSQGILRIYARRYCDIGVRHPASVAVLFGSLTN
jgi:HK97 family phage major capsid protein